MSRFKSLGLPLGSSAQPVVRPIATLSLIAINVVIYLLASYERGFLEISDQWVALGGFIPSLLGATDQLYRLLSSMFLHGNLLHILFNMYFLYVFGKAIEEVLGKWRFLALYVASGVLAAIFHTAFSFLGGGAAYNIPAIGASGAISGVLGAYLILFPGTTLFVGWFFFVIPIFLRMRAAYFLIMWFAIQITYGYARLGGLGGIAFFAHAGGFVAGITLLYLLAVKGKVPRIRPQEGQALSNVHTSIVEAPKSVKGLSRGTKIVVVLLLASLLAGAAYASFSSLVGEYVRAITLRYTYEGVQYTDYVSLQLSAIEHQLSAIPIDRTRILLNRLYAANLLYDEAKAEKEVEVENWYSKVLMKVGDRRVPVEVLMVSFIGKYDSEGFLSYGVGEMKTQVIFIGQNRVSVSDYMVHYVFEITSEAMNLESISQVTGLISLVVSASSLLVVLTKDKELTLVGEQ